MDKKRAALKLVEKAARISVEKNALKWPSCLGILHQPVRPKRQCKATRDGSGTLS